MNLSRRTFLLATAALLAQACAGLPLQAPKLSKKRRARYFMPAPGVYIGKPQDFSQIRFDKTLRFSAKGLGDSHSLITIVNDDGSGLKRVKVPGFTHAVHTSPDFTYLMSVDRPAILHLVDTDSFELIRTEFNGPGAPHTFGGHLVTLPDGKHFAITMNSNVAGKHDYVSIRERATLREVERHSSFGFEAHDIALSADGRKVFVAHYGSYIGSGPYRKVSEVKFDNVMYRKSAGDYYAPVQHNLIYPSATSVVELSSGKLLDRHSYQLNGPQGHLALGTNDAVYTSSRPALVRKRPDSMTHPAFNEGTPKAEWAESFAPKASSFGTTVVFDPSTKQVLVPSRYEDKMLYAKESDPDQFQEFNLLQYAPDLAFPHALCLHPDGQHYIVTASNWVVAFERATHKFVPEMSFPLPLHIHSHFSLV